MFENVKQKFTNSISIQSTRFYISGFIAGIEFSSDRNLLNLKKKRENYTQ